ncbi:MAG: PQQ-binding-like beta-propeller repeat protein [Phycisphaerae bacterium]|nr:PQQ-binding-like beta-propeller repeat protein [Phycisphaerae bacterium]
MNCRRFVNLCFCVIGTALLVVCGFAAVGGAGKAETPHWPGWRGVNRDGKSSDKGLLKAWPEGGPKLIWKLKGIGEGFSSVSIADGAIYTTGQKTDGVLFMTAITLAGKVKWTVKVAPGYTENRAGSRSTPTWDSGKVYIESGKGLVGCWDARTGKKLWTRHLSEFEGQAGPWGYAESVLIVGDKAVVTPGGEKTCLVALDKKTGETVWKSKPFEEANYTSPLYVEFRKIPMVVVGTSKGLLAVNAKTGKTFWANRFSYGNTANVTTPVCSNGLLFWSNGYNAGGICLKLKAASGRIIATEAWTTDKMSSHTGGYVVVDGHIYGYDDSDGWTCLELVTGKRKWACDDFGKGSLCYADGMLYLYDEEDGNVALAEASPKGLKITGRFSVDGDGHSWAHPVVAGGKLVLRYGDNLYLYDVRRPGGQ